MKTHLEQFRQARRIHGGLAGMLAASVGVKLSRCPIPRPLRARVYGTLYGGKYPALDERELEKPLLDYRSLNELFTRGVPEQLRPFCDDSQPQLSTPCDCTVQDVGTLQDDTILTVKQIPYQLTSLAPETDTQDFHNGHYAILFLSPRDCHRIFSPQNVTLDAITHVPGYRLLVHPPFQRREFPVFTLNERVVMELTTPLGRCLVIMVAGWGVGHITFPFPTGLQPRSRRITRHVLPTPLALESGEWLATFELGSTVVLITEPVPGLAPQVRIDEPLLYGQSLFAADSGLETVE